MPVYVSEVVMSQKKRVDVVRILLKMNTIVYQYPRYGIWCYLFRSTKGIVIFDPGPRYLSVFGGRGFWARESGNTERIIDGLNTYFPGALVSYIAASHYHFDHVENAPHVQSVLKKKFGTIAPIRLHANDYLPKRFLHIFPCSLSRVFAAAGYRFWQLGKPIQDGEIIPGTTFRFILCPGHTSGNLAIISDTKKLFIGGYWAVNDRPIAGIIRQVTQLADECPDKFASTRTIMQKTATYHVYTYHPVL